MKAVVPRSRSPSSADADVQRSSYVPASSPLTASVIRVGSAAVDDAAGRDGRSGRRRGRRSSSSTGRAARVNVMTISVGGSVRTAPSAGVTGFELGVAENAGGNRERSRSE